jgi:hypothetical protein
MAVALPLTRQAFNDSEQLKFRQSVARAAGVSSDDVSIDRILDMDSLPALRRLLATGIRVDTSVRAPSEVTAIAIQTSLTLDSLNSALVEVGLSATTILEAYVAPIQTIPDTTSTPVQTTRAATTPTPVAVATTPRPVVPPTTPTPAAVATTPRPVVPPTTPKPVVPPTTPTPAVVNILRRATALTTPTPALATAPADAQTATVVGAIVGVLAFFCCVVSGCLFWQTRKGRPPV